MRCTRCDKLAIPQAVGRTPGGVVVFGWCPACLAEERCELVEETSIAFVVSSPPRRRRRRRRARPRSSALAATRRRAVRMVAGFMGAWASILTAVGLARLAAPPDAGGGAERAWGATLLGGGGGMLALGLGLVLATVDRRVLIRPGLRLVQLLATAAAFGTLIWGLSRPEPRRQAPIVAIAAGALAVFAGAHWIERRLYPHRTTTTTAV